jgi:2-amino-4-hydroxy-6-hydroxymethyldihydropteridine diphosphokinase
VSKQIGWIAKASHLFETAPWGNTNQQSFLNQALHVMTELNPQDVLREIRIIEERADRKRSLQWGPRTLDIDILLYENLVVDTRDLTIPHPHMTSRRFVLAPLSEIAGDVIHPVMHMTISELLVHCPDQSEVAILAEG